MREREVSTFVKREEKEKCYDKGQGEGKGNEGEGKGREKRGMLQ